MKIIHKHQTYAFENDAPLVQIADFFQPEYESPILLALVNGSLKELFGKAQDRDEIEFVTYDDSIGKSTYKRSALMMLIKAFYDTIGLEKVKNFSVCFSLGDGLFITAQGDFELTEELLQNIYQRMMGYVAQKIPFSKVRTTRTQAMQIFKEYGLEEKSRLFHYRLRSKVNLYHLDNYTDYFYGYMALDTSRIPVFALNKYEDGFLLRFPSGVGPLKMAPYTEQGKAKLFACLKESEEWARKLQIHGVSALNDRITNEGAFELILIQEALMEKKIGQIAEQIVSSGKRIILVAGPSSSGKTSFSHRLAIQLKALGMTPHPIEVDNYFKDRILAPRHEDGSYNFESLECLDVEGFNRDMQDLLHGKKVQLPYYNFAAGLSQKGEWLQLKDSDILIIEGIHCLNDALSRSLSQDEKFKIYISALSQFHVDEHNSISATDIRLIRRIVRDNRLRGVNAKNTIAGWNSVRKGEEVNIFPYQDSADVVFNSGLVYELAVMSKFARPLLHQIDSEDPEYIEAKRLLRFLDFFLDVDNESVPKNSLVREFIGGSVFLK